MRLPVFAPSIRSWPNVLKGRFSRTPLSLQTAQVPLMPRRETDGVPFKPHRLRSHPRGSVQQRFIQHAAENRVPGQFLGLRSTWHLPVRAGDLKPCIRSGASTARGNGASHRPQAFGPPSGAKQRWGAAVPASRIRPRPWRGRLSCTDAATTRRPWQPVVAGLPPLP